MRIIEQRFLRGPKLVFGCGSDISELLEAIRPTSPEAAKRIETEAV